MIYRFEADGRMLRFDTDTATLLMSSKWSRGRDQTRWEEIYRTPRGRYLQVSRTLWQGERDEVTLIDQGEAVAMLALAEPRQRTEDGERLLLENDPSEEA